MSKTKKKATSLSESGAKIANKPQKENEISSNYSSSESDDDSIESGTSSSEESSEEETQKSNGNKVSMGNGIKESSSSSSDDGSDSSDEEFETESENQTIVSEEEESNSSSSDDSSGSSDEESENKSGNKTKSSDKAGENAETKLKDSSSSCSESEDSEDSSENENTKTKVNNGVNKNSLKNLHETSDSSSSEDYDSDEDSKVQNVSNNQEQDSSESSSDSSESESDSEEEENEDVNMDIGNSNDNSILELNSSKRKLDDSNFNSFKKKKVDENSTECKTIFVGKLSFNVDDEWLRQEFEEAGEVTDVRIVYDKNTGKSRGFGYVEFATVEGANSAMELAGKEIDGRVINVDRADQKSGSFNKKSNFSRGTSEVSNTIFIGNLSFNVNEDEIWETFGNYGKIVAVRLPTHEDTGNYKGYGYVEFADTDAAQKAMELHGTKISGRAVRLDFSGGKGENSSSFGNRRGRGGKSRGGSDNRRGRGGRGGFGRGGFNMTAAVNRGAILPPQGKKITFD